MDPKFVKLEEAAEKLKVSTETLNGLREEGKLRAYRDGASWKFRTEEIDKMAEEGVPALDAEESGLNFDLSMDDDKSGLDFDLEDMSLGDEISLDDNDEAASSDEPADADTAGNKEAADLSDLELADDELELATGSSADLTLDLDSDASDAPLEMPPVAEEADPPKAAESGLDIDLEIESGDDPESILLSEAELGDSADGPASTIIGKADLDEASDLELVSEPPDSKAETGSDVALADLEDLGLAADATGELPAAAAEGTADFDDIEELEIDLEAESSRILTPEDVAAAQAAGSQAQQKAPETSDLDLELDDDLELAATSDAGLTGLSGLDSDDDDDDLIAGSQVNLAGESSAGSGPGLTGLSALELDDDDDDDDFVLGDGSDLTLSSADSGINLSPADSGLSLDDAALELTGSALGSEIDFGEASGLVADEPAGEGADFELTPMAEDPAAEDDDSSQVIALDEFEEQQGADDLLGAGAGGAAMAPAAAGFGQGAVVARDEAQFPVWIIALMSLGLILLSLCGMMMIDVVRSMWSWDEPYQVNSTIIDGLSGIFFP